MNFSYSVPPELRIFLTHFRLLFVNHVQTWVTDRDAAAANCCFCSSVGYGYAAFCINQSFRTFTESGGNLNLPLLFVFFSSSESTNSSREEAGLELEVWLSSVAGSCSTGGVLDCLVATITGLLYIEKCRCEEVFSLRTASDGVAYILCRCYIWFRWDSIQSTYICSIRDTIRFFIIDCLFV